MNQIEHEVGSGNVYADLGFADPVEARAKAEFARRIAGLIKRKRLSRAQAAARLGIEQPEVSRLQRGQLKAFPMELLMDFMLKLDQDIEIRFREHRRAEGLPGIEVVGASP